MRRIVFIFGLVWAAGAVGAGEWALWDGRESVAEYAGRVGLPATKSLDLGNGVSLELVSIPAGRFVMGTAEPEAPTVTVAGAQMLLAVGGGLVVVLLLVLIFKKRTGRWFSFSLRWLLMLTAAGGVMAGGGARWDLAVKEAARYEKEMALYYQVRAYERRAQSVTLTQPFYMGKYTVTQEQYEAVTGNNPSEFKGARLPVETVSWDDAVAFCKKLTERLGDQELVADLPTEALWEYACRAGTRTAYYSGNLNSDLDGVAWYDANSGGKTHPVGEKEANAFGIYDMHGNVWQWCWDSYMDEYRTVNVTDPYYTQVASRVVRGGAWYSRPRRCRASYRGDDGGTNSGSGFRVVVSVAPSSRTL